LQPIQSSETNCAPKRRRRVEGINQQTVLFLGVGGSCRSNFEGAASLLGAELHLSTAAAIHLPFVPLPIPLSAANAV
jgi:hypothetical protein